MNLKVIIVDESETDAELAVRELARGGVSVTWERVENAAELREALLRPWDLVVSDASRLRALAPTLDRQAAASRLAYARLSEALETERRRIARALHDDLGQLLTALQLTLGSALDKRDGVHEALAEAMQLAAQANEHTRDFSADLYPVVLDDLGLPSALRWLAERHERWSGLSLELDVDPVNRLDPAVEIAAFRVAQQALTNIARHAEARRVQVTLRAEAAEVALEVRDDGRGFDVQAAFDRASSGASLGISGMRDGALLAGGTLEIASNVGRGTVVRAVFPGPLEVERVSRSRRPGR